MKIGVIIPTRGDRPGFIKNCERMMMSQTLQPTVIITVNFQPIDEKKDITKRYRMGYDTLRNCDLDVIALIEDDDWYAPNYLETMVNEWDKQGRPDLFGTNYTIYYNIFIKKYYTMFHDARSSAMSTLIKPDMNFNWCPDTESFTDSHLWFMSKHISPGPLFLQKLSSKVFKPKEIICLGIKHGIGKTGGQSHTTELHRYDGPTGKKDENLEFVKKILDQDSLNFYLNLTKTHTN